MALSPQRVRDTQFKTARKGYEPAEVDAFVDEVATALESAQNDATAMEARARAAVARLQELSQVQAADATAEPSAGAELDVRAHVEESETISRTLLLAQRTADQTVADAQVEADRVVAAARDEASAHLDGTRLEAERLVEEAKTDARRAKESERVQVEGEVQALLARRDFLEADVDHLEQYLLAQKERITGAVAELHNLVERVPAGLGDMRRPLLSAAADTAAAPSGDDVPTDDAIDQERSEIGEITRVAQGQAGAAGDDADDDELPPADPVRTGDATPAGAAEALFDDRAERLDVVRPWDAERG